MDRCHVCDRRAAELHPVPPEVFTPTLVDALDDSEGMSELVLCADCIDRLMEGETAADLLP